MTEAEYRAAAGVNWSTLKYMRDSPMAYQHAVMVPRADSAPLMLGRAVHTLVLQPDQFDAQFVVWDGGDRRGSEWKAFAEANSTRTILKMDEMALASRIADAVFNHAPALDLLQGCTFEAPLVWHDPATELLCKARPDAIHAGDGLLIDLKTTRCAENRRFGLECARLGYALQLAHYAAGCEHAAGFVPQRHILIAVEKDAPHDVGVFEVADMHKELARDEVAMLLQRVKECRAERRWPGRYAEPQILQLPAYVEGELEIEEL